MILSAMNTLVEGFFAQPTDFQLNYHSKSMFTEENHGFGYKFIEGFNEFSPYSNGFSPVDDECSSEGEILKNSSVPVSHSSPVEEYSLPEGDMSKYNSVLNTNSSPVEDFSSSETDPDVMVKFISQMLMEEEDLVNKPCMLQDCLALQATEKFFHDVLHNNIDENVDSPTHHFAKTTSSYSSGSSSDVGSFVGYNWNQEGDFESLMAQNAFYPSLQSAGHSGSPLWVTSSSKEWQFDGSKEDISRFLFNYDYQELLEKNERDYSLINLREKKNRDREDGDLDETQRSNKQSANNVDESEPLEMYDKVLLCSGPDSVSACGEAAEIDAKKHLPQKQSKGSNKAKPRKSKKQGIIKEVVDLRSLLMQCAQAVASYDSRTANDLLTRIRKHSSDHGDGLERLAHYFADALEARLAGTGPASYIGCFSSRISAAEVLKAYKTFITACPYRKMSNIFANRTIKKLAIGAPSLHIIDFGILYGFQWPCLIQALSERIGGPPKLRITGIDLPQPGFRPAERVLDTGNRLRKYCERFGVPFEYNAIAQKFETIKIEDLKIEKDELLVVNSIYRFHNVPDETVMQNCPRDAVLNLIRSINPNLFILGALNGTFNAPFFITRFREALFHFSSMFDMFDATVPRDDPYRVLFEQEILGKDSMNTIACEGTERVDRPETYKQWQVRNMRAGFRQVPLDREIVKHVRSKVKTDYHKDFSVDEDGKWMLQGWKGRVIHALSCWQPAN